MIPPHVPTTPLDAVGPTLVETVIIDGQTFLIECPAEPDRLLDHPAVIAAHERDEYMPYWCDLWPAARMLAKHVLRTTWPAGLRVLELGCGLGLPGIAALAKGLHVTFSDYDATALHFAAANARRNRLANFELLPLDWRQPPDLQFPLVLAADLIYEERNVQPVVSVLGRMLAPDGLCLLTDQDRKPAPLLCKTLEDAGFKIQAKPMHAGQPANPTRKRGAPGRRVKGTLYQIRRQS